MVGGKATLPFARSQVVDLRVELVSVTMQQAVQGGNLAPVRAWPVSTLSGHGRIGGASATASPCCQSSVEVAVLATFRVKCFARP